MSGMCSAEEGAARFEYGLGEYVRRAMSKQSTFVTGLGVSYVYFHVSTCILWARAEPNFCDVVCSGHVAKGLAS